MEGVTVVVPAYNAEETILECVVAARNLEYAGDVEIIVVNDGSSDRTAEIAVAVHGVRVINVPNGGAARATNVGIRAARYDLVASLDSDAVLDKDWLQKITPAFDDAGVAAVAGYAVTGNRSLVGKLMGYDVELRLDRIAGYTDHLYTMNTVYRRQALAEIGMFDERLRIAYDADISRRLTARGYRLVMKKEARCTHYWRDDLKGYLGQQYHYAYYRLEIARKFKKPHDGVAGIGMILHVPFTAAVLAAAGVGVFVSSLAPLLLAALPAVHLAETATLLRRRKDLSMMALPLLFTLRNLAWTTAGGAWLVRRSLSKLRGGKDH